MKYSLFPTLFLALLLTACPKEEDEAKDLDPIKFSTVGALAEPTLPTNPAVDPINVFDGTLNNLVYSQFDGTQFDLKFVQRSGQNNYSVPVDVFAASTGDSRNPDMAFDSGGTLHIVWEEGSSPNRDIFYCTRTSGGIYSGAQNLSNTTEDDANPAIHVDSSDRVHVVWQGATPNPGSTTATFYRRTQSSVFLAAQQMPFSTTGVAAEQPDVTTDLGNRVYIIWAETVGLTRDLRMLRSDDNGANFGAPSGKELIVSGSVDITEPKIAGGLDGEVFIAFLGQDTAGERGVFTTFTRTGGSVADPLQIHSSNSGGIRDLAMSAFKRASDDFSVMLTVNDGSVGGGNALLFSSYDNGENYPGDPVNVTSGNSQDNTSVRPCVSVAKDAVVVVYEGQPTGGGIVRTFTVTMTYDIP